MKQPSARHYSTLRPTTLAAIVADLQDSYAEFGDPLNEWNAAQAYNALVDNVGETDAARLVAQAAENL